MDAIFQMKLLYIMEIFLFTEVRSNGKKERFFKGISYCVASDYYFVQQAKLASLLLNQQETITITRIQFPHPFELRSKVDAFQGS